MGYQKQQCKLGLILEDWFIDTLWGEYFPNVTITKHPDIYNPIDFFTQRENQEKKSGQLKVIVPTKKYREISISNKQYTDYLNSGIDVFFHISPVKHPNEHQRESIDIELRCIEFNKINFIRKTTDIGTRWHIPLKGMKVIKLKEEHQRYIDDLYHSMVRQYEDVRYRTQKKFI